MYMVALGLHLLHVLTLCVCVCVILVQDVMRMSKDTQWRVRLAIVETLPVYAQHRKISTFTRPCSWRTVLAICACMSPPYCGVNIC